MASEILKLLAINKFKRFKNSFHLEADELFFDEKKKRFFHNGELGAHRERLVSDFLVSMVPGFIGISSGFVISTKNDVSTQCDIILYDKEMTPIISDDQNNRFYPSDSVKAIGEVKSSLNKSQLFETLLKLSKNKSISHEKAKDSDTIIPNVEYYRDNLINDTISFLICKKISCKLDNIESELEEMYRASSTPQRLWHNLIFSLDDGLFLYKSPLDGTRTCYTTFDSKNCNIIKNSDLEKSAMEFSMHMFIALSFQQRICLDLSEYLFDSVDVISGK
jgi:hypothetical protein